MVTSRLVATSSRALGPSVISGGIITPRTFACIMSRMSLIAGTVSGTRRMRTIEQVLWFGDGFRLSDRLHPVVPTRSVRPDGVWWLGAGMFLQSRRRGVLLRVFLVLSTKILRRGNGEHQSWQTCLRGLFVGCFCNRVMDRGKGLTCLTRCRDFWTWRTFREAYRGPCWRRFYVLWHLSGWRYHPVWLCRHISRDSQRDRTSGCVAVFTLHQMSGVMWGNRWLNGGRADVVHCLWTVLGVPPKWLWLRGSVPRPDDLLRRHLTDARLLHGRLDLGCMQPGILLTLGS